MEVSNFRWRVNSITDVVFAAYRLALSFKVYNTNLLNLCQEVKYNKGQIDSIDVEIDAIIAADPVLCQNDYNFVI